MTKLSEIIEYCDKIIKTSNFSDFPGAMNGLQVQNSGKVLKIGAAVDAGLKPFLMAADKDINLLIVHHGLFWSPLQPVTENNYHKLKILFDNDIALYSSHLPLDAHPELGNNAVIAQKLGLKVIDRFLNYEGQQIGIIAKAPESRKLLSQMLKGLFPKNFQAIEFGSKNPKKIAISSGSGNMVVPEIKKLGIDTLITGELRQNHFNYAQEEELNLYPCGHYATEIFGVQALAHDVSQKFNIPWEFIETNCIL